jgi:zinc transport system substrate-binding protein
MLNITFVFSNGNKDAAKSAAQEIIIAVSILPQSYFVDRISGGTVKTLVLVGPGQNPHSYEATPRQMAELSKASVWILSGTNFEIALIPKIKNLYPQLNIIDGTEGVTFRYLGEHDHDDQDRLEKDDDHDRIEIDEHTWLGREPAKILARHVYETLENINPKNADFYHSNYESLIKDIDEEFNRLDAELAPLRGTTVFVYHPSFGYFFDEFGIVQEAVEIGGKEPSPKQITELMSKAKTEHVTTIFVQAEFPVDTAKTLASSLGAEVFPLDVFAKDWLANIRFMGESLIKGIQK